MHKLPHLAWRGCHLWVRAGEDHSHQWANPSSKATSSSSSCNPGHWLSGEPWAKDHPSSSSASGFQDWFPAQPDSPSRPSHHQPVLSELGPTVSQLFKCRHLAHDAWSHLIKSMILHDSSLAVACYDSGSQAKFWRTPGALGNSSPTWHKNMNFKGLNCAQLATCQVPVEETAAVAPLRLFIRHFGYFGINTFTNLSHCIQESASAEREDRLNPKKWPWTDVEFFRGEMYWSRSSHTLYCHISTKSQMRLQKLGMNVKTCENLAFGNTSAAPYAVMPSHMVKRLPQTLLS